MDTPSIGVLGLPNRTTGNVPVKCPDLPVSGSVSCIGGRYYDDTIIVPAIGPYKEWQFSAPVTVIGLSLRYDFGDGIIEDYEWPGDNNIDTAHYYGSEGTFNCVLTIYDGAGQSGTVIETVNYPPVYNQWYYIDGNNKQDNLHRHIHFVTINIDYTDGNLVAKNAIFNLEVRLSHCWETVSPVTATWALEPIAGDAFTVTSFSLESSARLGFYGILELGVVGDGTRTIYSTPAQVESIWPESQPATVGELWEHISNGFVVNNPSIEELTGPPAAALSSIERITISAP